MRQSRSPRFHHVRRVCAFNTQPALTCNDGIVQDAVQQREHACADRGGEQQRHPYGRPPAQQQVCWYHLCRNMKCATLLSVFVRVESELLCFFFAMQI